MLLLVYFGARGRRLIHLAICLGLFKRPSHHAVTKWHADADGDISGVDVRCSCGREFFTYHVPTP